MWNRNPGGMGITKEPAVAGKPDYALKIDNIGCQKGKGDNRLNFV